MEDELARLGAVFVVFYSIFLYALLGVVKRTPPPSKRTQRLETLVAAYYKELDQLSDEELALR
jgi:hypothetical protein